MTEVYPSLPNEEGDEEGEVGEVVPLEGWNAEGCRVGVSEPEGVSPARCVDRVLEGPVEEGSPNA